MSAVEPQAQSPPEQPIKELPRHLRTERMSLKWDQWQEVRRGMKKPKSWLTLFNEQIDWLSTFSEPKAFEILSQSIRNGWQGLFEPKGTNENRSANNGKVDRNAGTYNEGKAHLYRGIGES